MFMLDLQNAVNRFKGPVTIFEIMTVTGGSDSRIRSHIKKMVAYEYVCCVGKTKQRKYVPSFKWQEDPEAGECAAIGGYCMTEDCENKSVEYFRGLYLCRDCLVGRQSLIRARDDMYNRYAIKSPAGWDVD